MIAKCLAAALALLIASSAQASGRLHPQVEFEPPYGMQLRAIGSDLRVSRIPTRIWQFQSTDDADALARYFAREWDGRIARHRVGRWDVLSRRDGDWLLTIQTGPTDANGLSHGFVAIAPRFAAASRSSRRDALANLPGSHVVQDIESDDAGRRGRTWLLVSEESPTRALDYLHSHLRSEGYEPIGPSALSRSSQGGAMRLNRGNEQVNVAVAERDGRTWISIVRVQP